MIIKTISTFLVLATVAFFNACSNNTPNKAPKCSDLAIVDTLTKILSTDGKKAIIDIDTIRKKIDLAEHNGMRNCRTKVDYVYANSVSKNNQVFYTIVLSETEKKYIVSVIEQ
ncbi:MAG: hypothetical protein L3I99_03835 [Sulfurimonas sp.]|nr:hypothetical protein [Sulfurimonas sp.]